VNTQETKLHQSPFLVTLQRNIMASITIAVEFDELHNEELDGVEAKLQKVLTANATKLPNVSDISETGRDEDDEETED
jgi:hypothetical protein